MACIASYKTSLKRISDLILEWVYYFRQSAKGFGQNFSHIASFVKMAYVLLRIKKAKRISDLILESVRFAQNII